MIGEGSIRLPVGVRDFLPRAAARRRAIIEGLLGVFESWGYARIIAPAFEYADVLERGLGADARAAAFRFVEPLTGEVVALRPDITPQVARMVATRLRDVGGPLRLCYEGAVTRLAGDARGQREVLQAGVELIGVPSSEGDAELLGVAAAALSSMQARETRLDIGHVALVRAALDGVSDEAQRSDLWQALARKDRSATARAAQGLAKPQRELLTALPHLYGAPRVVLARARALRLPLPARRALDTINEVLELAKDLMDVDQHRRITIDLGEVRGFEYYTGLRLAGYGIGAGDAILRGGRYDELLGHYGYEACATGFAVDVEAIAQTERSAGIAAPSEQAAVVVAPVAEQRRLAVRVAATLRACGVRVAVQPGKRSRRAALSSYAERIGAARVLIIESGASSVVDGEERKVSMAAVRRAARGEPRELLAALELEGDR